MIKTLGLADVSTTFAVERAHRISFRSLKPGAPPRLFLMRLLNYTDRDHILSAAKIRIDLRYKNAKLLFFADYPPEIQQQTRTYMEVRKKMEGEGDNI